jgi:hypothetical protein
MEEAAAMRLSISRASRIGRGSCDDSSGFVVDKDHCEAFMRPTEEHRHGAATYTHHFCDLPFR